MACNSRKPDAHYNVEADEGVVLSVSVWNPKVRRQVLASLDVGVVLVHQYTKMGGCGALMRGMAYHFAVQGFLTVTFDMRGAGNSSGTATLTGKREVKDVEAVCQFVQSTLHRYIILVGSSAGAPIAGSVLPRLPYVAAYVGVGYVFGWWASILFGSHYKAVLESDVPKLFIMGEDDGFTTTKQLKRRIAACKGHAGMELVPGVGHFELETESYDKTIFSLVMKWLLKNEAIVAESCKAS